MVNIKFINVCNIQKKKSNLRKKKTSWNRCSFFHIFFGSIRRKTTRLSYDPPYVKKPIAKTYGGQGAANHHSVEEVSLDGSNKLITYGSAPGYR